METGENYAGELFAKYFCEVVEKIVNLNISLNISVQNLPAINFLPEFSPGVLSVIWLLAYPEGYSEKILTGVSGSGFRSDTLG